MYKVNHRGLSQVFTIFSFPFSQPDSISFQYIRISREQKYDWPAFIIDSKYATTNLWGNAYSEPKFGGSGLNSKVQMESASPYVCTFDSRSDHRFCGDIKWKQPLSISPSASFKKADWDWPIIFRNLLLSQFKHDNRIPRNSTRNMCIFLSVARWGRRSPEAFINCFPPSQDGRHREHGMEIEIPITCVPKNQAHAVVLGLLQGQVKLYKKQLSKDQTAVPPSPESIRHLEVDLVQYVLDTARYTALLTTESGILGYTQLSRTRLQQFSDTITQGWNDRGPVSFMFLHIGARSTSLEAEALVRYGSIRIRKFRRSFVPSRRFQRLPLSISTERF